MLNDEKDSGIEKTAAKTRAAKGDPRLIITCDEIEEIVFGSRFDPEKTHGRRKNRKPRAIPEKDGEWKSVDMVSESDSESENGREEEEQQPMHDDRDSIHYDTDGSVPSIDGGVRIRPPQDQSEVNFSVGGERGRQEKIEESADDLERRRQGAKRAEEREMVRRAARRGVVFGFEVPRAEPPHHKKPGKTKGRTSKRGDGMEDEVEAVSSTTEIRKAEAIMAGMVVEPSYAKGNWSIRWRQ